MLEENISDFKHTQNKKNEKVDSRLAHLEDVASTHRDQLKAIQQFNSILRTDLDKLGTSVNTLKGDF